MRWISKKSFTGGGLWKWGNLPNFLFEVEFQVYTNIQAISTLVCLLFDDNGFVMCNYSIFYNTCYKNCAAEKWCLWLLQTLLLPQFLTYRHRTGFIMKRKQVRMPNWLLIPINSQQKKFTNFFICLFCPPKIWAFKKFH